MTTAMTGRHTQPVRWNWSLEEWELRCNECRDWLPITLEFWYPRHGVARCKTCWREYQKLYQRRLREDPDVVVGIRAAQRAKHAANREEHNAKTRAWKAANRDRVRAYQRAYYAANRDRMLEYRRRYEARQRELGDMAA